MTARQINDLNMHLAVRDVLDKPIYQPVWSAHKGFTLIQNRWREHLRLLESYAVVQGVSLKGIRATKERTTTLLLDITMEVAGALASFAHVSGDAVLAGKVDFTRAQLAALRDTLIDDRAQAILDLATPLAAVAAPAAGSATLWFPDFLAATADRLAALRSRITAYSLLVLSPTTARGERKNITEKIQAELDAADAELDRGLDNLIPQFAAASPDFVSEYTTARQVLDLGGSPAAAKPAGGGAATN